MLRSICCVFTLVILLTPQFAAGAQPNVIVILTDDQGWGDLSLQGNTNLSTPHIDSLARDGASMENFYVCQVCAPTRAEFLTGRYHPRTGVSGVSRGEGRLNPDEKTIADQFKNAGYVTGAFGKWHNGTQPPLHPNFRGFDQFYGFTSGHWGHYFSPPLDKNGERVQGNGFIVDDFTSHAIEFIRTNRDKPFFCYLPLNTPHSPMMVDDKFYNRFANHDLPMKHRDPAREDIAMTRAALAMCENIDWNVGRVLSTLTELNLVDDTIVVFFCDNGPNSYRWNGGMKGKKGSMDEGGLRSPLLIRWPEKIPANTKYSNVVGAIDLLPTLCDMVEIDTGDGKPLDGRSFLGLLSGDSDELPERPLYAYHSKKGVSVRTQRFRLDTTGKLFDITVDRGQQHDVSKEHPNKTLRLKQQAKRHFDAMRLLTEKYANRPFHVGFAKSTTLPARDGIEHGTIRRSSKAPNNSFFENWTSDQDSITWSIDVLNAGQYEAIVWHTCAKQDVGVIVQLEAAQTKTAAKIKNAFDPQLYDKSKERVAESHYFVKDFQPQSLGRLSMQAGAQSLKLTAHEFVGNEAIDVQAIDLIRVD